MNYKISALLLAVSCFVSGCAMDNPPYNTAAYTLVGGAAGVGVGAGTALAVSELVPGAIGAGALVGGVIGLPIGALIGYEIAESGNNSDLAKANREVEANQSLIEKRNLEISQLRNKIESDESSLPADNADPSTTGHLYGGPNL